MFELARAWKILIVLVVAITLFLSLASAYVRASQRGERGVGRKTTGRALLILAAVAFLAVAFAYDFGLVVLGAFIAIGVAVYLLYVLPKNRVRKRYM